MKTNLPASLSATLAVVLLFGSALSLSAVTYTNNTRFAYWTNGATWTPNFTTGDGGNPDTNKASTILVFNIPAGTGLHTNDYPIIVLNQLLQSNTRAVTLWGGGTLMFTNSGATMPAISNYGSGSLTVNEALNVTTTTIFRAASSGAITVNSNIFGLGSLVISNTGSGTVTLGGSNSYSGGTLISAGTLRSTAGFALGTGAVAVASGGVLQFGATATTTNQSGIISGDGMVDLNSVFTFFLLSSNAYTGGTLVSGSGRVALGSDYALGTGTIFFTNASAAAGGNISSIGSAARTLANSLVFSNNANFGNGSTDPGVLTLTGNANLGGAVRQLTISSAVIMSGVLSNGGLIKAGSSNLTLSGNNTYTGGTIISNGTLQIGAGGAFGWVLGDIANQGTLVFNRSDSVIFSNLVTGSGNLIQSGTGALTLSSNNTFSGVLGITAGQVILGNAFAAQNATVSNAVAGGLVFNNAFTAFTFGGLTGATDLGLTNTAGGGITLTVGGNNVSTTFGGALTGNGTLIKTGTGSLILSNANLSSVGVSNGTLKLTSNLVVSSGLSVASGAIFDPNKQTVTGSVTIASGGWMAASMTASALNPTIVGTVSNQGNVSVTVNGSSAVRQWGGLVNNGVFLFDYESGIAGNQIQFSNADSLKLNSGGSLFITNASYNSKAAITYDAGPVLTNSGAITIYGLTTNSANAGAALLGVGAGTAFGGSNLLLNAAGGQILLTSMGNTNLGYNTAAVIAAFLRNEGTLTVSGTNISQVAGLTVDGTSTNAGVIVIQGQAGLDFYNATSAKRHGLVNLNGGVISIGTGGELGVLGASATRVSSSASAFRNEGVVTNLGSITTFFNLTNAAGASLVSKGSFSTSVVNQGSMTFLGGTSSVAVGTLVSSGSLDFQSNSVLSLAGRFLNQGTVVGSGTVLVNAATNSGTFSPGHSPGTLTFSSNLTLAAGSILNIELGGTNAVDYDHLVALGALTLGGILNVTYTNGYTPTSGDKVDILDWGSMAGTFSTINLPSQWSSANLYSDGTLIYSAIPEPGIAWAVVVGCGVLALWRRARRTA